MPYVFVIPGPLREHSQNRDQVAVDATVATVREALELLWQECPGTRDRVLNELGEVRRHINIFIDGENVRDRGGLDAAIPARAEIVVLASVSGG